MGGNGCYYNISRKMHFMTTCGSDTLIRSICTRVSWKKIEKITRVLPVTSTLHLCFYLI